MRENTSTQNPKSTSDVQVKDTKKSSEYLTLETAIQHQQQVLIKELNIVKLAEEAQVDPFVMVAKPPSIIEVGGISLFTLGNISALYGKPKGGKTFYGIKLTCVVLDNNSRLYKGFKNKIPYSNVIYFDTEQSDYHVSLLGNRIVQKVGLKPETSKFSLYALRKHSPAIRLQIIEQILYSSKDVSFVIIDGIADLLMNGYNDEKEAIMIASKLLKWTQELNIHIVVVIHENKGNSFLKGHVGSQIMQKAETILNVAKSTRDDSISEVTASYNRGENIPTDYFIIDENGLPIDADAPIAPASNKPLKKPTDFDLEFKLNLVEEAFQNEKEIKYKALSDKLKHYLANKLYYVGDTTLRGWITYYKESGIILQEAEKKPYTLNSKFIQEERIKFKFE